MFIGNNAVVWQTFNDGNNWTLVTLVKCTQNRSSKVTGKESWSGYAIIVNDKWSALIESESKENDI